VLSHDLLERALHGHRPVDDGGARNVRWGSSRYGFGMAVGTPPTLAEVMAAMSAPWISAWDSPSNRDLGCASCAALPGHHRAHGAADARKRPAPSTSTIGGLDDMKGGLRSTSPGRPVRCLSPTSHVSPHKAAYERDFGRFRRFMLPCAEKRLSRRGRAILAFALREQPKSGIRRLPAIRQPPIERVRRRHPQPAERRGQELALDRGQSDSLPP
jgi:hypothetical protein